MDKVFTLLKNVQDQSSSESSHYVQHIVSSIIPPQRINVLPKLWPEWHEELCNVVGGQDGLKILVFAMMKSHCKNCEALTSLRKHANLPDKPKLAKEFNHSEEWFNKLSLAILAADLANEGFESAFVAYFARHELDRNPDAYQKERNPTFEGCLQLMTDAINRGKLAIEDRKYLDLKKPLSEYSQMRAIGVLESFDKEMREGNCVQVDGTIIMVVVYKSTLP